MVTPADDCPLPIPLVSGAAGFLLLLSSCNAPISGGQTGDGSGAIPEPEPGVDRIPSNGDLGTLVADCHYEAREVDDDEATTLGFSARDVLDFAEGSFATEITWSPDPATGIGFLPETQGGLTIGVRRDDDAARLLEPAESDGGVNPSCDPLLAIGVTIDFETEGGALRETVETELRATSRDAALFSAVIPARDLEGRLELRGAPASVSLDSVLLDGFLSKLGTAGTVQVILADANSGATDEAPTEPRFGGTPAAYWPSETCGGESAIHGPPGIVVEPDAEVSGRSMGELAAALEASSPVALTWSDGRASALRLELSPTRTCVVDQRGALRLRADVEVSFATDDGALSGTLPGTLSDDAAPGSEAFISLNSSILLPAEAFLDRVTLRGITVDGYDEVSFNLFLSGGESPTGGLSITGSEPCEEAPDAPDPPDAPAPCFAPLYEAGLGERSSIDDPAAKRVVPYSVPGGLE